MTRGRLAATLLTALLALAPLPGAAGAGPTREQALAALANDKDPDARRRGAMWLGETGVIADAPRLVDALRDSDPVVRGIAETALWELWSRSGDDATDRLFAVGVEQMRLHQPEAAAETFTRVIRQRPDFAEGWNKRATVYYILGDYRRSLADCDEVMKRNPYHFGALSGYGMIYLHLNQPGQALDYFERALGLNPNLRSIEETIDTLRGVLLERRKNAI